MRRRGIGPARRNARRMLPLTVAALVALALWLELGYIGDQALQRFLLAVTVLTAVIGLATALRGLVPDTVSRGGTDARDLDAVAQELAIDVQREWEAKAARTAVGSFALPVAWRPAESGLVDEWAQVVGAARGLPGGPPGSADAWPAEAAGLEGTYPQIGEVFTRRVPTRRLVIVGEPGSGKSELLIRLLQELGREGGSGPVPVLFSLASWNPSAQDLTAWMAEQLRRNRNVALRHSAAAGSDLDRAAALVQQGLVLPLLDGFDELPPAVHAVALHEINRAWRTRPLVLASRTDAYRAALQAPDARRLDGAAGIHLEPLSPGPAADYLRHGLPHPERWDAVIAHLGTATPLGQVLSTPLGLFLARTSYAPPPRLGATTPTPHPDELCDTTRGHSRDALERHLFSRFLTTVYDDGADRGVRPRWSAQRARHTLATLARHLETQRGGSTDIAWWELSSAVPAAQRHQMAELATGLVGAVTVGLVAGVSAGLDAGLPTGVGWGLAGLLGAGLLSACAAALGLAQTTAVVYPSSRFRSAVSFGLLAAFVTAFAVYQVVGARAAQWAALITAALLWSRFNQRLTLERADLAVQVGPGTLVDQDRRIFCRILLLYVLGFGAWGVFQFGLTGRLWVIPALGIGGGLAVGLAAGLARGFYVGFSETAWAQYAVTTACLALRRQTPWSVMAFLQDAHERGVLRQVGTVYQFRHVGLQRYLAAQPRSADDALPGP
ncbi:NACHT domain-containing protein [Streptomyces sp. NPDC006733]|uniref:NACHT domain-containing protein n=1 Tax=Streptomyces sp. NPDC006733 TaxID=3155460 RepID=UPI0033F089A9